MIYKEITHIINKQTGIRLSEKISPQNLEEELSVFINGLIKNNFQKLITILYSIDINETELKSLLLENSGEDAAAIIAKLIIERQRQKIESRKQFNNKAGFNDSERW